MNHELPNEAEEMCETDSSAPESGGGLDAEGRDGERLLNQCSADLCVDTQMAIQIVAWAEENVAMRRPTPPGKNPSSQTRAMAGVIRILEYLKKHTGPISIRAVCYVFDDPLLDDIIGHKCPAEIANEIGVSREAVNKEVLAAQRFFGLPPRRGQRGAGARKNMSLARLRQLQDAK